MKKTLAISLVAVALMTSGCGKVDRWFAGVTGDASETCHEGVTYLQFTSGATVQVDREGRPVPCGRE